MAVWPLVPPLPVSVGVLSLVMSSVAFAPESELAAKSGALDGVAGGLAIVSDNEDEDEVVFPAGSVSVALTVHEPVDKVGKSHEVLVPIV